MYLIDTSVWIDYLRSIENQQVNFLKNLLDQKLPFGITGVIYQEILQGAATKKDFGRLSTYLASQTFYHPQDATLSYQAAAKLYFNSRNKGITIRSSIDCLIAQIAIENNLLLLHNDKDFIYLNKFVPELKLVGCN